MATLPSIDATSRWLSTCCGTRLEADARYLAATARAFGLHGLVLHSRNQLDAACAYSAQDGYLERWVTKQPLAVYTAAATPPARGERQRSGICRRRASQGSTPATIRRYLALFNLPVAGGRRWLPPPSLQDEALRQLGDAVGGVRSKP